MKINFDVDSYRTRFLGGARSYLFFCIFALPTPSSGSDMLGKKLGQMTTSGLSAMTGISPTTIESGANIVYGNMKNALSPFGLGKQEDLITYLVKSTTLPASHLEERVIDWQGIPYKMAGDRTYEDWMVTFNIDEKGEIINKFYEWQKLIHNPDGNVRSLANDYMRDQEVHLVDYDGNSIRRYKLYGAWPKSISHVQLDYSTNDIAQLEIIFSYQYHEIMPQADSLTTDLVKRGAQRLMGLI